MKRQALLFVVLASLLGTTLAFGGSYWGRGGSSGGGGSVTSIATTGPLSGGTITTTGTLSCPTCTTSAGMTSGVIPVASGAHALVNSVFGQNASALVAAGSTAAVGGIGFNNAGNVEVIADGSTVVNAGLFAGTASDFTLHDSTTENNFQFLIYNDADGIANGLVLNNYGTFPNNGLGLVGGNGAGGVVNYAFLTPDHTTFFTTNFQFGAAGSNLITSPSGGFVAFDVSGATSAPNGFSKTFLVTNSAIPDTSGIGAPVLMILQQDGTSAFSQISTANNAGTAGGINKIEIVSGAGGTGVASTLEVNDTPAGGGDVSLNLFSPSVGTVTAGVGTLSLNTAQVGTGTAPYLFFPKPGGGAGFAIHAPDSFSPNATQKYTWPSSQPAANGQPLVATTAGVMSFAAGLTENFALCTGTACATTCTLTVVGGIITGKSGTCP